MTPRNFLFIVLFAAAAGSLPAQTKKLQVLTAAETEPGWLLPPAPADGSALQEKELAEVRQLLAKRSNERFAQASWDNAYENVTAFAKRIENTL